MQLTYIIPTFNRTKSTLRAIDSILSQDTNCNIIVVDDCSSVVFDYTAEYVNHDCLSTVRHPKNLGPAAARNTGLKYVQTELVAFLDSDDFLIENTLKQRLNFAINEIQKCNDMSVAIGCGWQEVDKFGAIKRQRLPNNSQKPEDFFAGCWFSPGSAIILQYALFADNVGYYDEKLLRLEDYDWFLRFGKLGNRYICDNSIGVCIEIREIIEPTKLKTATTYLLNKYSNLASKKTIGLMMHNNLQAYLQLELAVNAYKRNRKFEFVRRLLKSFYHKPRIRLHLSPAWKK